MNWTGDLNDHCVLNHEGLQAICEDLGDTWHVTVSDRDRVYLLDTAEYPLWPESGKDARAIAELVIKTWLAGRSFCGADGT